MPPQERWNEIKTGFYFLPFDPISSRCYQKSKKDFNIQDKRNGPDNSRPKIKLACIGFKEWDQTSHKRGYDDQDHHKMRIDI